MQKLHYKILAFIFLIYTHIDVYMYACNFVGNFYALETMQEYTNQTMWSPW